MKQLITTLKNIWSITELKNKLLFTVAMLAIYRMGSYVVLPGVIPSVLEAEANKGNPNDLLGLINVYTGGAFNNAAIFALGIMPYITASIIVQLLGFAVPYFQRLQQHEGESGRKKINQITRVLTVAITLVQSGAYLTYITTRGAVSPNVPMSVFWLSNTIVLTAGTVFAMWLGERINDKGIGNGVSLIIMTGIMSRLPSALIFEFQSRFQNNGLIMFIVEIAFLFLVVMLTIMVVQGVRKIPIQFAKRMVGREVATMPAQGNRDYIPLKVNGAGVMPIIFAQALMFLPATAIQYLTKSNADSVASPVLRALNDYTSLPYNVIYFILIVVFTYVYTALIVNPRQYSEYLSRQNAFIPGVKPGENTENFIDNITTRITLPGAVFLGLIAIMPAFARAFGINNAFAAFFGGTSLLIFVGVILDTLQQIESHLLMQRYDGLVKSGRVIGRNTGSSMQAIGEG